MYLYDIPSEHGPKGVSRSNFRAWTKVVLVNNNAFVIIIIMTTISLPINVSNNSN